MFQVNGANGIYDNKIADSSVKYGRNAVENHIQHLEKPLIEALTNSNTAPILDFAPDAEALDYNIEVLEEFTENNDKYLASLPPLEYEYRNYLVQKKHNQDLQFCQQECHILNLHELLQRQAPRRIILYIQN